MFDTLTARLGEIFKGLRGRGKLNEKDIERAMREIRLALLEADVNYKVVKDFINRVKEKSKGEEILKSLTPGQQVVKVVHDELAELMGKTASPLTLASSPPTMIMLVGLQGTGKTSVAAKIALYLKGKGKRSLMVAADVHRPAAADQLKALGKEISIDVLSGEKGETAISIVKKSVSKGEKEGYDAVILDTAGRLHVDEEMMNEVRDIKDKASPHQVLFIADSMTGQDAVNQARTFNDDVGFDGVILTKLDGDARGGAALSIKAVTGKPIKFISVGEKARDFEVFYPDRMASRILGMGDVLSLIEKAEETVSEDEARKAAEKMLSDEFGFDDFLVQIDQMNKMGGLDSIMKMLPSQLAPKGFKNFQLPDDELKRTKAIIQSMTEDERRRPKIISGSRRSRIAKGSGTSVNEVNKLLKQFAMMKKMMKNLSGKKGMLKPGDLGLPMFK